MNSSNNGTAKCVSMDAENVRSNRDWMGPSLSVGQLKALNGLPCAGADLEDEADIVETAEPE